ncbi:hypothetical protein GALMADRAFT_231048 [Galerina marginata CBS 339.88]|uniref:Major facilitator superfamily (MFS) profile domain-containing protein n=1 Tax=Galerina marginata (strain CBS 339.88) TaxID=685588 RepID=A0A067SFC7_GALM3|nr:hypothetical protein GALMADRAFT_231048 [Galerina marginata CBS 339.88]
MSSSDSKHSEDLKIDHEDLKVEDIEKTDPPAIDAHYDPVFVKKTIRLIDWRMLPLLGMVYAVALIDRTNLGVARTAGMGVDLRLDIGERYSIASMVYFFPYILLQIPGNIILRWLGSRTWLTTCVVGWGIAQLGMAFVTTWGQLAICRVFLGAFEAGFFPSLAFIITTWYKRYEVQKRLALFYLSSITITGFSSILAYAITLLKGKAGLNGWQWIFLLEGLLTIVLGVLTWFFIPDFPDKSRFITEEQRKMVLDRVQADRGDSVPDKMTWDKLFTHLKDPLLWAFAAMFLASTMPAYAIGFFITIILRGMGYSETLALILTAPPSAFAAVSCFFFAWLADRTRMRAIWMVVQNLICITGLLLAAYSQSNPVRYFGLFLVNAGATGCVPAVLAYSANNITSHTKRAVQTATIIAAGGVGGIMATTVFRQQDFPRYVNGMWATIGLQILMMILLGVTTFVFKRRNRLRREGKIGPLQGQPDFYHTI